MERARMKYLTIAGFSFFVALTSYGTGGDWFDYPAKLSDTLDMLPGKSLGAIFLETSVIPSAEGSLD